MSYNMCNKCKLVEVFMISEVMLTLRYIIYTWIIEAFNFSYLECLEIHHLNGNCRLYTETYAISDIIILHSNDISSSSVTSVSVVATLSVHLLGTYIL